MFEILSESAVQKERFRVAANKLLNQCFLLKRKEDTKRDYIYVKENRELFAGFFDLLGYDIRINEDQGVIALVGQFDTGRLQLTKSDSILLLILRLLYLEKRRELSSSYEDVIVLMEEIREKYELLRLRTKRRMDKGMEQRMVSLFKRYNIIRNLDSDVNQADTRIVIYPSILMALPVDDINEYYSMTRGKLREYADDGGAEGDSEPWAEQGKDENPDSELKLDDDLRAEAEEG